jgi:hypothetical protein
MSFSSAAQGSTAKDALVKIDVHISTRVRCYFRSAAVNATSRGDKLFPAAVLRRAAK